MNLVVHSHALPLSSRPEPGVGHNRGPTIRHPDIAVREQL
ncbi:hypothetical protein LAUMK4_03314 [Mycobacterium persicum]|uniref:Uncharacterized protein n=1 Tax=Mycobacterium persicum TaxID=1487726 RepID=A0AB38UVH2_9MYCO|nr:hypothetical protein LAUMK15_03626 [Mycobacterium persicum]VAZ84540.1 hypothetical protein LAUMK42_03363 [Mycobacterium persicum]VAZ95912.1 hypothetical protein LAUMK4_03314 [Mycobacterium persicum]